MMSETILHIRSWGNNLGVRLPAAITAEADLSLDQLVRLSVVDGGVLIQPILNKPLTLEQLLDNFDPELHRGEAMITSQKLGAEQW